MIHVRPFRAWRPAAHAAHLVGSRSFLQYSPAQLREKLAGNPYTFLNIIHARHDEPGLTRRELYEGVRRKFNGFVEEGILVREARPAFYLYEQSCDRFTSRGIIAAVDVADYTEGRIKRHEHTLTARENMFCEYLGQTAINAEPVLLAVPHASALEALMEAITLGPTLFDFSTTDRVRHRFWKVDGPEDIGRLGGHFREVPALYIADGHHRCASSALLAEQAAAGPGSPKSAFLAILVPESQLHIYNFDRTVKGLNGLSPAQFLEALGQVGRLSPLPGPGEQPAAGCVEVYAAGAWHELTLPPARTDAPVEQLDADRLSAHVLGPVLGITDLRTDPRIAFVPGTQGPGALAEAVDGGQADTAFHLRSVTFDQLCAVADSGACMPPKTTWIEPKLRSGLTIYSLEDI